MASEHEPVPPVPADEVVDLLSTLEDGDNNSTTDKQILPQHVLHAIHDFAEAIVLGVTETIAEESVAANVDAGKKFQRAKTPAAVSQQAPAPASAPSNPANTSSRAPRPVARDVDAHSQALADIASLIPVPKNLSQINRSKPLLSAYCYTNDISALCAEAL